MATMHHGSMLPQPHMQQMHHPSAQPGSSDRAPGGGQPMLNGQVHQNSQMGSRIYSLQIEQQPDRARMCGFGDKDRRPITPPPCIRLIVRDAATGREVSPEEVDPTRYVLLVDLWDAHGTNEVNLVRHSNTSPSVSISMATTTSYPPPADAHAMRGMPMYGMDPHNPAYGGYAGYAGGYGHQAGLIPTSASPQAGMFTRNLIGSVSVSASTLTDLQDQPGFWFVLQDLSVRQEGIFRLKCSFIDVSGPSPGTVNQSHCAILASVFSEPFTVWSAKKFPGVKESTPLSKCFAGQGVKIPIRKDGGKGGKGDDDDD